MEFLYHDELDKERMKGVYAKIDANYIIVNNKIDSNHKELKLILDQILVQTTRTNGRVCKLETETEVSRFLTKNKIISLFALAGLTALFNIEGFLEVIKKLF